MTADEALAKFAARHRALFRTSDARACGVSATMLTTRRRHGQVDVVEPGVWRMCGAPPTWEQLVLAATWSADGVASHRTAGALWPLDGCRPGIVEVTTERWKRRPNRSVRLHETRLLHPDDVTELDGIALTTRERTIVDLAAVVPPHRVEAAMDTVGVDLDRLWECIERLDTPGRPWVAVPRRLAARRLGREGVPPNAFERRFFEILRRRNVPLPDAQVEIRRPDGSLVRRVDWLLASWRVVMECDSFLWHGAWRRRTRDIRGDRELTALGYRVLRFSWEDLDDGDAVATDVLGAIRAASA